MRRRAILVTLTALIIPSYDISNGKPTTDDNSTTSVSSNGQNDTPLQISRPIRCILQDRTGNLWFGTDGDGVWRYDGNSFTCFTEKEGLCNNQVRTIQEDQTGNLWFGTGDGVCRYDGKSFTSFADKDGMRHNGYLAMKWHSKPENLWFGTRHGAYRYDGRSFTFLPLRPDDIDAKLRQTQPGFDLTAYSVYSILEDKTGNLWFGTQSAGVCRYDGKSFAWFTEKGLSGPAVRSIFQDKSGNLWFGNNGGGVFHYDGITLTNFTEEKGLGNPDFLRTSKGRPGTLARVWTIAEDKTGNLWIGTIDAGAWRYDGKTLTNFTVKDGLSSNAIWTIYKDKDGDLWFGTDGGGVCKYDGKSFTNFTRKGTD